MRTKNQAPNHAWSLLSVIIVVSAVNLSIIAIPHTTNANPERRSANHQENTSLLERFQHLRESFTGKEYITEYTPLANTVTNSENRTNPRPPSLNAILSRSGIVAHPQGETNPNIPTIPGQNTAVLPTIPGLPGSSATTATPLIDIRAQNLLTSGHKIDQGYTQAELAYFKNKLAEKEALQEEEEKKVLEELEQQEEENNKFIPHKRPDVNYRTQRLPKSINKKEYSKQNDHLPKVYYIEEYRQILFDSAADGKLDVLRAMINYFDNIDIQDEMGNTPLIYATVANNTESVRTLLFMGANPNATNYDGISSIYAAIYLGYIDIIKELLTYHSNPNGKNINGESLIMIATKQRNIPILNLLLRHKANINATMNEGDTALHIAIKQNHPDVINTLLINGADTEIKNNSGHTPLLIAAYLGQQTNVRQLLDAGANSNTKSKDGYRASEIASARGFQRMAEMIESHQINIEMQAQNFIDSGEITRRKQLIALAKKRKKERDEKKLKEQKDAANVAQSESYQNGPESAFNSTENIQRTKNNNDSDAMNTPISNDDIVKPNVAMIDAKVEDIEVTEEEEPPEAPTLVAPNELPSETPKQAPLEPQLSLEETEAEDGTEDITEEDTTEEDITEEDMIEDNELLEDSFDEATTEDDIQNDVEGIGSDEIIDDTIGDDTGDNTDDMSTEGMEETDTDKIELPTDPKEQLLYHFFIWLKENREQSRDAMGFDPSIKNKDSQVIVKTPNVKRMIRREPMGPQLPNQHPNRNMFAKPTIKNQPSEISNESQPTEQTSPEPNKSDPFLIPSIDSIELNAPKIEAPAVQDSDDNKEIPLPLL